jgi:tetratricopeptide (TPR) repeat protein
MELTSVIRFDVHRAKKLIEQGLAQQKKGDVIGALEKFQESIRLQPNRENYLYCAWMLSLLGKLDEAILMCMRSIEIDPNFGNPYNDIGIYFMKKQDFENAMPWLEKAKELMEDSNKHLPMINLGRIYLSRCNFKKALQEFESALRFDTQNIELQTVIARLRTNQNL